MRRGAARAKGAPARRGIAQEHALDVTSSSSNVERWAIYSRVAVCRLRSCQSGLVGVVL